VLMPSSGMDMAVLKFILRWLTQADHFYIEM
jgi:hypothetical protein